MSGRLPACLCAVLALLGFAASAGATACGPSGAATGSPLALGTVVPGPASRAHGAAAVPELWLAQRSIEREWTSPDDSAAIATRVPGQKSEMAAALLSAVLPGSGELYVGEKSGLAFLAAEIAGLVSLVLLRRDADDMRDDARLVAGAPTDTASAWSFERWAAATGDDPAELEAVYAADPDAFWDRLARDPALAAGWESGTQASDYSSLWSRAHLRQRRSNQVGTMLWINHLVSAADALRAARLHNLPLGRHFELRARGGIKRGSPTFVVALTGRF